MKISGHRRKGISPIVATVLIIAATLIAFAAVLGYIFGIFGGAGSTANITVSSATCTHGNSTAASCTISVTNSGTGSATLSGGSITYGGATYVLSYTSVQVAGGTTSPVQLASLVVTNGGAGASGEAFTGSLSASNGAQVTFAGTMQ